MSQARKALPPISNNVSVLALHLTNCSICDVVSHVSCVRQLQTHMREKHIHHDVISLSDTTFLHKTSQNRHHPNPVLNDGIQISAIWHLTCLQCRQLVRQKGNNSRRCGSTRNIFLWPSRPDPLTDSEDEHRNGVKCRSRALDGIVALYCSVTNAVSAVAAAAAVAKARLIRRWTACYSPSPVRRSTGIASSEGHGSQSGHRT